MRPGYILGAAVLSLAAACKPPPTDTGLDREMPEAEPVYASPPSPSPETGGARWAQSSEPGRIVYGVPGERVLLALSCDTSEALPRIVITRLAAADEDAGALMALVGNGHYGRVEIDATQISGKSVWQATQPAASTALEPLAGPRQVRLTVPGAGTLILNPSSEPMRFVSRCRNS